jgi:SAM-dependent methyltransferase
VISKIRAAMNPYTDEFFDGHLEGSRRSARLVVPMIMELVRPKRVVDVGCGRGTWLAAFRDHGAEEILGIDGEYVDRQRLEIAAHEFLACDLSSPIAIDRRFDLAVSLEVAEHLPEESADAFVALLTSLAPVVLFSAAIPGQGGTNHVNEQWPDYWAARFEYHGYHTCDYIRDRIWDNPDVEWWYAQNVLLFSHRHIPQPAAPAPAGAEPQWRTLSRVHPRQFTFAIEYWRGLVRDRDAEIERLRNELERSSARREDVGRRDEDCRADALPEKP